LFSAKALYGFTWSVGMDFVYIGRPETATISFYYFIYLQIPLICHFGKLRGRRQDLRNYNIQHTTDITLLRVVNN
jgi:hypothetical protein